MNRICENPLDCEFGDSFPNDGRALFWRWDITNDHRASTLFEPNGDNIDPSVFDLVFMQITAELEGKAMNYALWIDPYNLEACPYGWKGIHILAGR